MNNRTFGLTLLATALSIVVGVNSLMLVSVLVTVGVLSLIKGK